MNNIATSDTLIPEPEAPKEPEAPAEGVPAENPSESGEGSGE